MTQVWTMVVFSLWSTILARCDFLDAKTLRASRGKVNYTEADKACKSNDHRSHLAKVQTIENLQLAKNVSNTTNGIKYWMGLSIWNGTWKWSDGKTTDEQFVKIVKNYNDTEALSKEPKMLCCMVTHDALLECANCSERQAFLCDDFQEKVFPQKDANSSCIPAFPQVSASARNASCIFYEYKGKFCKDTITSLYVYGDQSTLEFGEAETESFEAYFEWFDISGKCQPIIKDLYCRYHFPPCDETLGEPKDRGICRSSCEYLMDDVCEKEAVILRKAVETSPDVESKMINCSYYIPANGGDAPECYQWPDIPGDETNSTDCYYGVGVGYHGNLSVTRSGRTCQSWKSQCPHRHWRIPRDVAESKNNSNMCRNPDGSAPDGPWCYTTDPNVRWEYCNVSRCPPREKPPPPRDFAVKNVQATYLILNWKEPENASIHQIQSYKIERKTSRSENFTVAKIVSHPESRMIMENLEPSTEYIIRLSSSNMYGRSSDGALLTQSTLPDRFIMNFMLIIVLPLGIAFIFVVTVCAKFGSNGNLRPNKVYDEAAEISIRRNWVEIHRSDVTLQDKLGEGAFGEVFKGVVCLQGKSRACAIKKLKENTSEKEREDLLNELQILVTVGEHPNIISLIGACTKSGSIWVIVSLAPNGCLLNELKKNRENPYYNDTRIQTTMSKPVGFTRVDKVKIARDVACGMSYLASKKCVHRDLAARNVLLGDRNAAMVSDFGLSRDVYESGEYESLSRGMLPVRWMALESLDFFTFNAMTDVWSFGVLLWEIESGGILPYCDLGGAMEIIDYLQSGQILAKPDGCTNEIYDMMRSCWDLDPMKRPSFTDLLALLEEELTRKKDDLPKDMNLVKPELSASINLSVDRDDT